MKIIQFTNNKNEHIWNITSGVDEGLLEFINRDVRVFLTKNGWEPLQRTAIEPLLFLSELPFVPGKSAQKLRSL